MSAPQSGLIRLLQLILLLGLLVSSVLTFVLCREGLADKALYGLIWPAMVAHQAEELVFSGLLLGPRFAFLNWAREIGFALTPRLALGLNIGIGWTMAIGAGLVGDTLPFVPLFVIGVEAVNAFWHVSIVAYRQSWSPGTLTGALLTIPLGFAIYSRAIASGTASAGMCFAAFIAACAAHHAFLRMLPRTQAASRG